MNSKSKNTRLTVVLWVLAVIAVTSLCFGAYMAFFRKPADGINIIADAATDENGETLNDGKVHPLPKNMLFSAGIRSLSADESEVNVISATVSATIKPVNAGNKAVDWTLQFVNPESEWASGKTVSDYVTVTPKEDGSLIATVSCHQAFGEQIRLTVTSRDNPEAKASCRIDYKQQLTGIEIALAQEGKEPTVNNSSKAGTVFADFENENPLNITYSYQKSDVYTRALEDSEIDTPVLTVEYKAAFTEALNKVKENSAKIPAVNNDGNGYSLNLFSKGFIDEKYTPAETNAIIKAIKSNKYFAVIFYFTIADKTIARYSFTIDTSAIENQMRVEGLEIGSDEIVFSEDMQTYTITYLRAGGVNEKTLFEIGSEYGLSKADNGFYPETYTSGEKVKISNLKSSFRCSGPGGDYHNNKGSGHAEYEFKGWYLDNEKTIPFNGILPVGTTGNITLYADISMSATHAY